MLKRTLLFILLCSVLQNLCSQQFINGVINSYYKVTSVSATSVQLDAGEDVSGLHSGDKVILMQMTGITVNTPVGFETSSLTYSSFANAGSYSMLAVKSVNSGSKQVDFTATIPGIFTNSEKIQLIKIYEADYATVNDTIRAAAWDGNKGGVVAMVIFKKLVLNSSIDVSAKGFRGADSARSSGACRTEFGSDIDTFYFRPNVYGIAGKKGEGNITASWIYTKGPGRVVTGGGGGLGLFAGGGGGSNYGQGGGGGMQKDSCHFTPPAPSAWSAKEGFGLTKGNSFYFVNRVILGGGGGSSTQEGSHIASKGGNGGGIVIIIADTLSRSGSQSILSNGESVAGSVTGGGGGGGAGGSVLLDINVYRNGVDISAKGGNGGNTLAGITGGGGGGGGGLFRFSGSSLPSNVTYNLLGGIGGNLGTSLTDQHGGNGAIGDTLRLLRLPLNGFLFNSVTATDTICAGQSPDTLHGSVPKGGQSGYTYLWLQSTDSTNWVTASGTGGSFFFKPDPLTQTTWFTRKVTSGSIVDTALPEKVFVYPALSGNLLTNRDTLCFNTSPGILTGGIVDGGNHIYSYVWESKKAGDISWSDRHNNNSSLPETRLTASTYYRRIVSSAKVCIDTSMADTITILPLIHGNFFLPSDTAICMGRDAGTIFPKSPLSGGDGYYSYQWLSGLDSLSLANISGANQQNYMPGNLFSDIYYKRIVNSGRDNACRDTSKSFFVKVYPNIGNNTINTDSSRFCAGDTLNIITGSDPSGGNYPNYSYIWQIKLLNSNWGTIGDNTKNFIPSTAFEDTVQINRIVVSGKYNACKDTSVFLQINVIPYIINNLISNDTAICEGAKPLPFFETAATGGAGNFHYQWQSKLPGDADWLSSPADTLFAYTSGNLNATTLYRRQVRSEICSSSSRTITIIVYPHISGNIIQGGNIQYVCYNSSKLISGFLPSGGKTGDTRYYWEQSDSANIWGAAFGYPNYKDYNTSLMFDSSFYRRIVNSGENNQCTDTSIAVLIRINSLPAGNILSKNDTLCAGDNLNIGYSLTGNSPWTLTLGNADTTLHTENGIENATGAVSFSLFQSASIEILDVEDDSTCHADPSGLSGLVNVKVYEVPIANPGINDEVCGLKYSLKAIRSVGNGLWTSNDGVFDNPANDSANVISNNYGTGTFRWTETNWHCSDSGVVEITFYEQPIEPNAGENDTLDYKFLYELNAEPPLVGTGHWQSISGGDSILSPELYNSEVTFSAPGEYFLRWIVENGVCASVSDTLKIKVGDLQIYTGFSPNDDGVNDEFILKLSGRYTSDLMILDSWGGVVFKTSGEVEVKWDGRNKNGKSVPEGTYYFILKEPGIKERTGYIELRR